MRAICCSDLYDCFVLEPLLVCVENYSSFSVLYHELSTCGIFGMVNITYDPRYVSLLAGPSVDLIQRHCLRLVVHGTSHMLEPLHRL
jgi:hypothetical protein